MTVHAIRVCERRLGGDVTFEIAEDQEKRPEEEDGGRLRTRLVVWLI